MPGRGPAPTANPRRRNARPGTVTLPRQGRSGPPPAWPLVDDVVQTAKRDALRKQVRQLRVQAAAFADDPKKLAAVDQRIARANEDLALVLARLREQRKQERALWAQAWATPQATQWEILGWTRDVATFVRLKIRGELGELAAGVEARQWSDRLGLNPRAMKDLFWEIGDPAPAQREESGDADVIALYA